MLERLGYEPDLQIPAARSRLVLRAYETGVGPVMNIYDARAKKRVEEPKYAADIEDAKAEAEKAAKAIARHVLKRAHSKEEVSQIVWQKR